MNTTTSAPPSTRLTAADERDLVVAAKAGDRRAADQLARAHLPFMRQEARRLAQRTGAAKADLLSACFLGFCLTLNAFDPDRGVRFLTYARHWFRHAMQAEVASNNIFGRGPSSAEEEAIRAMKRGLSDPDEIAADSGVLAKTARSAATLHRARRVSLDRRLVGDNGEEDRTLHDVLPAPDLTAEEQTIEHEEQEAIRSAIAEGLSRLPTRERVIVEEHVVEGQSLADLGRRFGFCRERARQLGERGKTKLRDVIQRRMNERMASERRAA